MTGKLNPSGGKVNDPAKIENSQEKKKKINTPETSLPVWQRKVLNDK